MRTLRPHLVIVMAAALVAACSSDDDGVANGPLSTLGTVPTPENPADTTVEPSGTADSGESVTTEPADSEPVTSDATTADGSTETTTTMLTPSPDADLPTGSTPTEPAPATTLPGPLPTPEVRLTEVANLATPVEATSAEGDSRLFVVQRGGTITAFDDESNQVVFDIAEVGDTTFTNGGGEQGLLGLAFHPSLDLAYVNFTDADGDTVIGEFAHDPTTFRLDPGSFREVLTIDQPFDNHNGGELAFGPDDLLYIGTGDGGSGNDPNRDALDLSSRLGKLLRIDPTASETAAFTVPEDNPFVDVEGADPTIWSLGLRNPWKFSFDSLTGDLWIADVGQNQFEEIDLAPAVDGRDAGKGLSFGWSAFEADARLNEDQPGDGHVAPVASYSHENGGCSVSGGVVARDSSYDRLNGWYVYGDFCSGQVWALDTTSVSSTPDGPVGDATIVEIASVPGLAAVVEGPLGDIYALSVNGLVYRLGAA